MNLKTPNEVIKHYGKENIVSIVNIAQILFYADENVQPVLIYRSEFDKKLVAYYLMEDTENAWRKWRRNKPV